MERVRMNIDVHPIPKRCEYHTSIPNIMRDVLKEAYYEGEILSDMSIDDIVEVYLYERFLKDEISLTDKMRQDISNRIRETIDQNKIFIEDILKEGGTP